MPIPDDQPARSLTRWKLALKLMETAGPEWLALRAKLAAEARLGITERKFPMKSWESFSPADFLRKDVPAEAESYAKWRAQNAAPFFVDDSAPSRAARRAFAVQAVAGAERILAGEFVLFSHHWKQLGFPPVWQKNAMDGSDHGSSQHWSRIASLGDDDVKLTWELSRFSFAFTLARAYEATRDERFPDAFWRLLEDWMSNTPPNSGPNWMCGQEAAFRIMAVCFAYYVFRESPHTRPIRRTAFVKLMHALATRIEGHIGYAISQNNNHSISEAVGLWTAALLFPELKDASRWRALGKKLIESESERLIYDDGSFVQHSANYHRLVLDDLTWAIRLGEINDMPLAAVVKEKLAAASQWLLQMMDHTSGEAPNLGPNDGSQVLQLHSCGYEDFRPCAQRAEFVATGKKIFPDGDWNEPLYWFYPAATVDDAPLQVFRPRSVAFPQGGYYTMRGEDSWGMVRCAEFVNRPTDADQLHFDLWWQGVNIACDAGTYLYNGRDGWCNALASTRVHNAVSVGDADQMTRAGVFLWLDWARGRVTNNGASAHSDFEIWQGEHDGYSSRKVTHRRCVVRLGDHWVVIDDVLGAKAFPAELHWLLPDAQHEWDAAQKLLRLFISNGSAQVRTFCNRVASFDLLRAGESVLQRGVADRLRGWQSLHYAEKQPAISLVVRAESGLPVRFVTVFSFNETTSFISENEITIGGGRVALNPPGEPIMVRSVDGAKEVAR
jgi:hypothetical protein